MEKQKVLELSLTAAKMRRLIVDQVYGAASGHPGGSLSIADILSVLYWQELNIDPSNPSDPNRVTAPLAFTPPLPCGDTFRWRSSRAFARRKVSFPAIPI